MRVTTPWRRALSWNDGRPFCRSPWASMAGLLTLAVLATSHASAMPLADQERPGLDVCAAFLVKGRAWRSDIVLGQVDGIPTDLDVGIEDGTTEDGFALQRAAQSYAACVRLALVAPERSNQGSLGTRTTVLSGRGGSAPPPVSGLKNKVPPQKTRPYALECMNHLKSFKTWQAKFELAFPAEPRLQLKHWSVTSDLPTSANGRRSLNVFAQCIGQSLQVSQKPEIK
jgi:hypothetical protein